MTNVRLCAVIRTVSRSGSHVLPAPQPDFSAVARNAHARTDAFHRTEPAFSAVEINSDGQTDTFAQPLAGASCAYLNDRPHRDRISAVIKGT